MPLYKKWWFWLCIVAITIIISFSIFNVNSGISEVSIQVESVDNECTLYTSAEGNTVVVEIPNYKDETKLNKVNNIKQIIKNYSLNSNILSNYSKFILICKIICNLKKHIFIC